MMPSLFSGVSGLENNQLDMSVIGNNLANLNTVGYKSSRVTFSDLVYQTLRDASAPQGGTGGTNPVQVGLGSLVSSIDTINTQGTLTSTGQSTDMAIQGNGYLVVGDNIGKFYTRDGTMLMGQDGDLYSPTNGLKFKGWQATNGVVNTSSALTNINIPIGQALPANPTSQVILQGNLDATTAVNGTFSNTTQVYDSLGVSQSLTITYTNQGGNVWKWAATNAGGTGVGNGTITFTSAGAYSASTGTISMALANGAATPLAIAPNFTGATQFAGSSSLLVASQNGSASATLTNFSIGAGGQINGIFSDGTNKLIGQLALATFNNDGALTRNGQNLLSESANSGIAAVGAPGANGRGTIVSGSLEQSNVDIAQQFTDMIISQRAFQANSKVISTSDQMLQDLVNMKQ